MKELQRTGAFTQAGQDILTSASNFYLASVNERRQVLIRHGILLRPDVRYAQSGSKTLSAAPYGSFFG